ncbi:serine hydrolase domain-containing protein [Lacibacter sediminis]|uniref:Serine hydrolase n=1 Tax=Lacibacter sediminis TaxID=2760713 RepID=A0A7G5XIY2_9BACT|nr:serine hydrolase [Lacibacter sediminis]QNA45435.1 serine hydrolase [Lacibacter sediminis]
MRTRKIIIRSFSILLLLVIAAAVWYATKAFPIISGYFAKNLASGIYLQNRTADDVVKEDLAEFPFSLCNYSVNDSDRSVSVSVWGFAKKKAIYRDGIGCTLINDLSEEEIRKQVFNRAMIKRMNPDSIAWPNGDKLTDTIPAELNQQLLKQAVTNVMQSNFKGKPSQTRAVVVLYNGQLVAEQYATGFDKNTVMTGWSVAKSLTSAMIGILVKEGKLAIDAPAPVPEWKNTAKEKITLHMLLQQTTGVSFEEDYTRPSEVTNMLFRNGDMAAFTAKLPLKHEPGTAFNYSSGNTNILSRIIRHTVGEEAYADFPYRSLFHQLNMYSMLLEPDASGTYVGSSYSYATARDFARFGLLYYNNGMWNGEQLLPADWVQQSIQPSAADKQKHYGYQFWLNGFSKEDTGKRWYPDVPADMFFADGYGGQDIYIIPSKKLVVVRLGLRVIDENKFLKEIIASVQN